MYTSCKIIYSLDHLNISENYIAINRGICVICETGVGGFLMENLINNQSGTYQKAIDTDDVYLRLESKENLLSGFYATDAGNRSA